MEQPQPLYFICQQVDRMKRDADRLNGDDPRKTLMAIGEAAESVSHEIEHFLKWGPNAPPG
ncbi:MAG: hypothetical protein GY906_24735 [bacterium]|nr:hypothetical protein [bacterium]